MPQLRTSLLNRPHLIVGVLLGAHAILVAYGATRQSPTFNEPGHLASGLHILAYCKFSTYRVNPPLVRIVAALPVALSGYRADWDSYLEGIGVRPEFEMGEDLLRANGRRSLWLFALARWACIPFYLLGGGICYLWARDLFGWRAGLFACLLWCNSPLVLGQAMTITPDSHATSLGLAACYTFWRWLKRPTWYQASATGALLGLAELSKTTLIVFYPLWPLIWIMYRWPTRKQMVRRDWCREGAMLLLRMLIGVYVLNIGYLGQGSFRTLDSYRFVSRLFGGPEANVVTGANRFEGSILGKVPVPFPSDYVYGIDLQQRDFEDFGRPSYLRGRYQANGWWYYYAYAISVKASLGNLGLMMLSVLLSRAIWRRIDANDTLVLLLPPVVIFVVVSMKCGFSHDIRYILPCVPFLLIWISGLTGYIQSLVTTTIVTRRTHWADVTSMRRRESALGLLTCGLAGWSIISSLSAYPHNLSYFNELAGGPKNGPRHLLNSNIDWGQDLLHLERWIQSQETVTPIYLAFYNYYNPFTLGISRIAPWPFDGDQVAVLPQIPDGLYAISVNLLYEFPWQVRTADGSRYFIDTRPLAALRRAEPIGWAGYSIRLYSAEQLRLAYATPPVAALWSRLGTK